MGIKLVMDMIPNHCGSFHWFFTDPPMQNWFNNQNEFKQTSHRRETVQDIYASEIDKKEHGTKTGKFIKKSKNSFRYH